MFINKRVVPITILIPFRLRNLERDSCVTYLKMSNHIGRVICLIILTAIFIFLYCNKMALKKRLASVPEV